MDSPHSGGWSALKSRLGDADPETRAAAARDISEARGGDDMPPLAEVLAELAERDRLQPGVADCFYGTWLYGYRSRDEDPVVARWVLEVLGARPPGALHKASFAVGGNNLEFYAHEIFEADAAALTKLLAWGYLNTVEMALNHRALPREEWIALVLAVYERTREPNLLESLAIQCGVVHADLAATTARISLPGGAPALIIAEENARFWEARWILPARPTPLGTSDPSALFAALLAADLPFGSSEASFDEKLAKRVPFPDIPGTTRITSIVRIDTQMTIALQEESTVAIRLVRTKSEGTKRNS